MLKPRRNKALLRLEDPLFPVKPRKAVPHEFVLDAIAPLSPRTNPMFGCLAVYVEEKIVLILRDKRDHTADNGVWLATTEEHHESLRREFPNMRSIQVLGKGITGWQILPSDAPDFESAVMRRAISFWRVIRESERCQGRGGPREQRQIQRKQRNPRNHERVHDGEFSGMGLNFSESVSKETRLMYARRFTQHLRTGRFALRQL